MTSGLSGSPAASTSRRLCFIDFRSSWMNMRHTVGGAHSEVTLLAAILSSMSRALNRGWLAMNTVAPAFQGVKKQLQACFAQPGEEMFKCTSPDCRPSKNIVDRLPIGYDRCECNTS